MGSPCPGRVGISQLKWLSGPAAVDTGSWLHTSWQSQGCMEPLGLEDHSCCGLPALGTPHTVGLLPSPSLGSRWSPQGLRSLLLQSSILGGFSLASWFHSGSPTLGVRCDKIQCMIHRITPSAMHMWNGRRYSCVDHALDPAAPLPAHVEGPLYIHLCKIRCLANYYELADIL